MGIPPKAIFFPVFPFPPSCLTPPIFLASDWPAPTLHSPTHSTTSGSRITWASMARKSYRVGGLAAQSLSQRRPTWVHRCKYQSIHPAAQKTELAGPVASLQPLAGLAGIDHVLSACLVDRSEACAVNTAARPSLVLRLPPVRAHPHRHPHGDDTVTT